MTKAYKYQKEGAKQIAKFKGRALLADEMGLGKSYQALRWYVKDGKGPLVIVCPASLKYNWANECAIHFGLQAEILEGRTPPRKSLIKHKIVIINYDILGPWLPFLKRMKAKTMILDECHYVKNPQAMRTKYVRYLCTIVKYVIALSGTPLTNRPAELWPILHMLKPKKFKSFFKYAWRYCEPKKRRWGWEYKGAANLKHLHKKISKICMIRRTTNQVLKDLPPNRRHMVPLAIGDEASYREARDNFLQWLRKQNAKKATKARSAERLVQIGYLKRLAAELKLKQVQDWVDSFLVESDEKLILFAYHKPIIKRLKSIYNPPVIDGKVRGKKRHNALEKFQTNPATRILLGNYTAMGIGLNITAANHAAFVEMPWTPGEINQCEKRINRIGQKKRTNSYFLIAKGTIEEDICRITQDKQSILDQTIDGADGISEFNIYNQLEQILLQGAA